MLQRLKNKFEPVEINSREIENYLIQEINEYAIDELISKKIEPFKDYADQLKSNSSVDNLFTIIFGGNQKKDSKCLSNDLLSLLFKDKNGENFETINQYTQFIKLVLENVYFKDNEEQFILEEIQNELCSALYHYNKLKDMSELEESLSRLFKDSCFRVNNYQSFMDRNVAQFEIVEFKNELKEVFSIKRQIFDSINLLNKLGNNEIKYSKTALSIQVSQMFENLKNETKGKTSLANTLHHFRILIDAVNEQKNLLDVSLSELSKTNKPLDIYNKITKNSVNIKDLKPTGELLISLDNNDRIDQATADLLTKSTKSLIDILISDFGFKLHVNFETADRLDKEIASKLVSIIEYFHVAEISPIIKLKGLMQYSHLFDDITSIASLKVEFLDNIGIKVMESIYGDEKKTNYVEWFLSTLPKEKNEKFEIKEFIKKLQTLIALVSVKKFPVEKLKLLIKTNIKTRFNESNSDYFLLNDLLINQLYKCNNFPEHKEFIDDLVLRLLSLIQNKTKSLILAQLKEETVLKELIKCCEIFLSIKEDTKHASLIKIFLEHFSYEWLLQNILNDLEALFCTINGKLTFLLTFTRNDFNT